MSSLAKRDCGLALCEAGRGLAGEIEIRNSSCLLYGAEEVKGKGKSGVMFKTYLRKCLLLYAESLAVHGDMMVSEGDM